MSRGKKAKNGKMPVGANGTEPQRTMQDIVDDNKETTACSDVNIVPPLDCAAEVSKASHTSMAVESCKAFSTKAVLDSSDPEAVLKENTEYVDDSRISSMHDGDALPSKCQTTLNSTEIFNATELQNSFLTPAPTGISLSSDNHAFGETTTSALPDDSKEMSTASEPFAGKMSDAVRYKKAASVEKKKKTEDDKKTGENSKAKTGKRKAKHDTEGRVQKTRSSYLLFSIEHRKTLTTTAPGITLSDASKICGKVWREMEDEEKEIWQEKARVLKEEATAGKEMPPKPKRPPSSYILFAMDKRKEILAEQPDLKLADISKKCGELWRGMSESEKEEWKKKGVSNAVDI